jgi:hypothetical protein
MPLYTVVTQDDTVSDTAKAKIAEEITGIHSGVQRADFSREPRGTRCAPIRATPTSSTASASRNEPVLTRDRVVFSGASSRSTYKYGRSALARSVSSVFECLFEASASLNRLDSGFLGGGLFLFNRLTNNSSGTCDSEETSGRNLQWR